MSILRPLFAVGLLSLSALAANACSSKDVAIPSGGVKVQLSQATGTGGDPSKRCGDTGANGYLQLVDKQSDGQDHLLVDGQGKASVQCTLGGSDFKVNVNQNGLSFEAHGTVSASGGGFKSTDTEVRLSLSSGNYHPDPASPCTVTFDTYGNGSANATGFSCPGLLADNAGMCAITTGFFKFDNCN